MPEIRFSRVIDVSSADPRFPAENLLDPDGGGRWRSAKAGEKEISVVLELAERRPIARLHLGNDGAAFVEALVGEGPGGDFQVLLPPSLLMSPGESRVGEGQRRVRLFGGGALVPGVAARGWGRLRLVLRQPYCQTRPFGLAFVRVFSPPEDGDDPPAPPVLRLGHFTLREEGGGGGCPSPRPPGALFYRRPPSPTVAPPAAVTGPSYADVALRSGPAPKLRKRSPPTNGASPSPPSAPSAPSAPPSAPPSTHSAPSAPSTPRGAPKAPPNAPTPPRGAPSAPRGAPTPPRGAPSAPPSAPNAPPSAPSAPPSAPSAPPSAPSAPSCPLGGVVLVLSGFQNPLRSRLRAAALELGASYRPDWTPDSTHLVSAFPRTPKAARARAQGGAVVGAAWIWDCQRLGRKLPCAGYLLDGSASSSSEGEGPEEAPPTPGPTHKAPPPPEPTPSSDSDPDDSADQSERDDPYGGSTEENSEEEGEGEGEGPPLPPLPDFFKDKTFFLHGTFPVGEGRLLQRYVIAFGGTLVPYMDDSVTHVVTAQDWDPTFEEALRLRPSLTFVRPHWLLLCGERERPLPAQPYAVGPTPTRDLTVTSP